MQTPDTIPVKIGEIHLNVPTHAAARALLDMVLPDGERNIKAATPVIGLPAIGAEWNGGIYAGLTIYDNAPAALVLLPGDDELTWHDAMAWAIKQGGMLPSRIDALVLFQNLKDRFKQAYYWTSSPYAGDESYAWFQSFDLGGQYGGRLGDDFRARAVRRFPI